MSVATRISIGDPCLASPANSIATPIPYTHGVAESEIMYVSFANVETTYQEDIGQCTTKHDILCQSSLVQEQCDNACLESGQHVSDFEARQAVLKAARMGLGLGTHSGRCDY